MNSYGSLAEDSDKSPTGDEDTDIYLVLGNPSQRNRKFIRTSSVILPSTGERVHRKLSFRSSELQPLLLSTNISIQNKAKILMYMAHNFIVEMYQNEKTKSILKCSLAYLIGSLGVYWSVLNRFLGNSDFKHVIATVVVYFHPSRTKGSMHITLIYVIISISFSFLVCFGCRFLSASFYKNGSEEVSMAIDLVVSSVSLGVVAFMKQKVNKETFNTACSLASISIVACIIKEGSMNGAIIPIERLLSTLRIVVTGCFISVAVCYLLWPQTAESLVKKDLNDSFNLMSSILSVIVNRFLKGENLDHKDNELFNRLNSKINNLKKNLADAKYELYFKGKESEWKHLEMLIDITISLVTNLRALRSSTEMQWRLLHESPQDEGSNASLKSFESNIPISQSVENLTRIQEVSNTNDLDYSAINSSQMFDLFVYYLAPSTKAFVFTIKNILNDVPFQYNDNSYRRFVKTAKFQRSLVIATTLFNDKQVASFDKLYDQEIFKSNTNFLFKSDLEEVTACCGNFSSLLGLFGDELLKFLVLLSDNSTTQTKSWDWIKVWSKRQSDGNTDTFKFDSNLNDALLHLQSQYQLRKVDKNDLNVENSVLNLYSNKLWQLIKVFKRIDIQFGIRVGLGAFVLSLFAFYPRTKFFFTNWRGEWSLTIYCIMMNKSLGGTQMTVKWRFLGTFLGSTIAWIVWLLFDGHPFALGLVGFLLSTYCFNIIIYWKKNNAFGRFILLTYNLTALYSYTVEQHDAEDDNEGGDSPIISEVAFHRFISVSVGVIWALTMASIFIPNSARSRLKTGLTVLWLRIGVIWNSDPLDYRRDETDQKDKLISLKGGENALNNLLNELEVLLKQAPSEFRLKGKFPTKKYESLLSSSSKIVDALHNMILIIEVDPILSTNEKFVINYIETERHELEHRIFLIFYMIASSMKLQFPLPSKPASTEHAKDRLLYKLSEVRSNSVNDSVVLCNEDYVLLYSYILVTSTITQELDKIIEVIKQLMGDISEDMFQLV
ncbi:hypothetical protein CANTEDRAFT_122733 [Yamadazyma tenuis ATCC 10573]|uniref:Uncharacterized protein n=1 Tax=Candida tenuis (strain ATCC 10573 / BCRC 21748 / CBS 615 / JCM 9827 / NBRC 10315 / NRRL Y-1498 / VKM Y-70) TaxID=590646 RepID=G3B6X2_CANTC|nr:uncharacterized protein CANTEDRAFT_122733 [Yamadazyma tenuis ATCC 10573]EGV63040.1 hypothetical protein CANTEDRAFT_122733 [Yamadazyma tenuis ATCC 10573]